jgi:hypothetical protein
MKEIEVTSSKGRNIDICPICKKIIGDVTLYLPMVKKYFTTTEDVGIAHTDSRYPEMINIPFKPIETCQCEEEQSEVH